MVLHTKENYSSFEKKKKSLQLLSAKRSSAVLCTRHTKHYLHCSYGAVEL
jgi:hypothetical protein